MSLINYASNLWDNADSTHLTKLHSVHRRAIKIMHKMCVGSSDSNKFHEPFCLKKHLMYNKCILMHKIFYEKGPSYLSGTIMSTPRSDDDSRHMTLILPKPKIDLYKSSLKYSGTLCWNSLPKHLKEHMCTKPLKKNY